MKKAIVTGANGFIGHYLVTELVEKNYHVIAVVRNEDEIIDNIVHLPNIRIVYCDMNEVERLGDRIVEDVRGCVFYHLAWAGNSGAARGDYILQMDNAKNTVKAATVASKLQCKRFVVAGSVTQLMYRDYLRSDGITPDIVTCYAVGKMAAEAMLKCVCAQQNIELCWAYIANFYGTDDPTQNIVNFLISSYHNGVVPELTAAEQLADFMHVSDVARALYSLGERGKGNSSYYIGYGFPRPLKYFINVIHEKIAPEIDSGIGQKKFNGMSIDYNKIDYLKLTKDTGFKPLVSFEEGIGELIEDRIKKGMI